MGNKHVDTNVLIIYSIANKYSYVQMAALSGNILFCNKTRSKIGDTVIFIRHIGGPA